MKECGHWYGLIVASSLTAVYSIAVVYTECVLYICCLLKYAFFVDTILLLFRNCSSSARKPLVTRKVQASSSAEESGGDSSAELDAAGSTKDSETSREPELNAADSDDGPPDLPEGD